MKKKILIFSLAYYPKHIGGAEVAIKEITDRLPVEKYEFHLVCNRYDSTLSVYEKIGAIGVHRIGLATKNPTMADLRKLPLHLNKIIYQWQAFWFAKKLHKKEQFDGVWAMMAHATGVPAAKFKKAFPEVKYLLTLQEGDPPAHIEKKMKVFGSAFTDAFITADAVQVISNFLGSWATEKGFAGKPVLIPNAVNTAHFVTPITPDERHVFRQELGLSDSDTALVTTSRLVDKNGLDIVIRALPKLSPTVKFVVFGVGPEEEKLQALATELHVADRVLFKGQISHEVMPQYLKACDIFIRPSRSEGMGNSFIEAMAAELPVIATQEGGISDFLFDAVKNPDKNTTGWAVAVESAADIVNAVADIQNNPEKTAHTIATAKAMVLEKYDWELVATQMDEDVFTPLFQTAVSDTINKSV